MFKIFSLFVICMVLIDTSKGRKLFEVIPDRIEVVYENKSIIEANLKVKKMNKIRSFVGSVVLHVPFGNDFKGELLSLKKQGGEYRYLPYKIPPGPVCDTLANDVYIYPDFAKNSDFPEDVRSNCPFPVGNYSVHGFTVDLKNAPIIMIQSGEYAGELIYYRDNQKVAVYRAYTYINNV